MVIFIGGLLATLGAGLQGGAMTVAMLIAGRFIAGLAVGLMSATIPVYCVCSVFPPSKNPHLQQNVALPILLHDGADCDVRVRLHLHESEASWQVCSNGWLDSASWWL